VQGQAWAQMLSFLERNLKDGGVLQKPAQQITFVAPLHGDIT